jgi:biotin operon repressor
MVVVRKFRIAGIKQCRPRRNGATTMARSKNATSQPATAPSASDTTPTTGPQPGTGTVAGGPVEAVRAALAATPDVGTTASIATAAGVSRTAASKALTTLEADGIARRTKGTGRGTPDTWQPLPADPATSDPVPGSPGSKAERQPQAAAQPSQPGASASAQPGDTTSPPGDDPATPPPPDPAVIEQITGSASQITVAAAAMTTALEAGDLGAARHAIVEIRDHAAEALRAVKTAAGGSRSGTGARPGQLRDLVAGYLHEHPGQEFTPHAIGKALDRSSGAVANALDRLASLGQAVLSSEKPRRYRHTGQAPAPAASAAPAAHGDEPLAGAA